LVYKVKAIVKSNSLNTFASGQENEIQNTPIIILAVDRDTVNVLDDFKTRVPNNAPIYLVPSVEEEDQIGSDDPPIAEDGIFLKEISEWPSALKIGESVDYNFKIIEKQQGTQEDNDQLLIKYEINLTNKNSSEWSKYFKIGYNNNNRGFRVTNLKSWLGGQLVIQIFYSPDNSEEKVILKEHMITLQASY